MPYKDIEKQRAANRASYAKRAAANPGYSRKKAAEERKRNPTAARDRQRRYRAKHPKTDAQREADRQRSAKYYAENGEELRAKQRLRNAASYAADPEKSKAATKRWAQNNPEKGAERQARRRARKKNAPVCERVDRLVVAERDGWICHLCHGPIDPTLTYRDPETGKCNPWYLNMDHVIPLAKGGAHSYDNCRASHSICNKKKAASILVD